MLLCREILKYGGGSFVSRNFEIRGGAFVSQNCSYSCKTALTAAGAAAKKGAKSHVWPGLCKQRLKQKILKFTLLYSWRSGIGH